MIKVKIGTAGVDSGQLMVSDPCYVKDFISNEVDFENKKEKKEIRDYKKFIVPFFEKGYTITDMFRIKNLARHTVSSK